MDYKKKYLKYKLKYLTTKKIYYGGNNINLNNKIYKKQDYYINLDNNNKQDYYFNLDNNNKQDYYNNIKDYYNNTKDDEQDIISINEKTIEDVERQKDEEILKKQEEERLKKLYEEILKKQEEERLKKQKQEMLKKQEEERLKKQEIERLKKQEEERLKKLYEKKTIDECDKFTVCQKFENCGLIAAINLFIKIRTLNNRLLSNFKEYFETFESCPVADEQKCQLHPNFSETDRIYLKYMQLIKPSYFSNGNLIHKKHDVFQNNTFDIINYMAYFMTICELNNIEVDVYEYDLHYESPSKMLKEMEIDLLYSPRRDIHLSYSPSFNCLKIKTIYPNFRVLSQIIKKYFLKLNFNQSTASTESSSNNELSKLVGGIVSLHSHNGRIGHAISFTICEEEMVVSNWNNTFNTGTIEGLDDLENQLEQLYNEGLIIKRVFLMYEVSIQKRLLKLGEKMGINYNAPDILNELRRREPSFSNFTPASIILKHNENPNNFNM